MSNNKRFPDNSDNLNKLQASERIELNPAMENVLRAKLGNYRDRLSTALSQERIPGTALDTKVKILILETLLKNKNVGGGDIVVTIADNEQVLDLAETIGGRRNLDPAALVAVIATNALEVIKDYNANAGKNVDGSLPEKGVPPPELN